MASLTEFQRQSASKIILLSHMLWKIVLPVSISQFVRTTKALGVQKGSFDDTCYDDPDEVLLFTVAEALFPLVPLVGGRAVVAWGNVRRAFYAVSACGAQKVASWMLSNTAYTSKITRELVLIRHTKHTFNRKKSHLGAFALACGHGHLQYAQWLSNRFALFGISENVDTQSSETMLSSLCAASSHGNEIAFNWLLQNFSNTVQKIDSVAFLSVNVYACLSGNLSFVKLVAQSIHSSSSPFTTFPICSAACKSGNLELVKWVVSKYHFSSVNSVAFVGLWLRKSCQCGHLPIVSWLIEHFQISQAATQIAHHTPLLVTTCLHSQFETFEWLIKNLLPVDNTTLWQIIQRACLKNRIHVAQWLLQKYSVDISHTALQVTLEMCSTQPSVAVLQWFDTKFNITVDIIREFDCKVFRNAIVNSTDFLLPLWMKQRYGLDHTDAKAVFFECCSRSEANAVCWLDANFNVCSHLVLSDWLVALQTSFACRSWSVIQWILNKHILQKHHICSVPIISEAIPTRMDIFKLIDTIYCLNRTDVNLATAINSLCGTIDTLHHLKWFVDRFSVSATDIEEYAFSIACSSGNLEAAIWLQDTFPISRNIALCADEECFAAICNHGNLDAAKWFVACFNPTKSEALCPQAFKCACMSGSLELVQWFVNHFSLSATEVASTSRFSKNPKLYSAEIREYLYSLSSM